MQMERKRVSNELYRVLILMWGLFSIFCAVRDYDWFDEGMVCPEHTFGEDSNT